MIFCYSHFFQENNGVIYHLSRIEIQFRLFFTSFPEWKERKIDTWHFHIFLYIARNNRWILSNSKRSKEKNLNIWVTYFFFLIIITIHYTSNSFNLLLVFTKMLGYKKFCVSSSSSFVGDVGDPEREGPLILRVGKAVRSFFGVFFTFWRLLNGTGSLWHSTISTFSRNEYFLSSSLSQSSLFEGFSEKRLCLMMKIYWIVLIVAWVMRFMRFSHRKLHRIHVRGESLIRMKRIEFKFESD